MARFLSAEWFDEVAAQTAPIGAEVAAASSDLVIEQVVRDTPDGEVRYRVAVQAGRARIEVPWSVAGNGTTPVEGDTVRADLTITCGWPTAVALAQGKLAAQTALMEGRLRIKGNLNRVAGRAGQLLGLDPVPEDVRRRTTY